MSEAQSINIVEDSEGDLRVSSLTIAARTENQHASVMRIIREHQVELEQFGLVGFEIAPRPAGMHGGGDSTYALLNEPQSTLLMTFMRNSPVVVEFKVELVKQFYRMRQALTKPTLPQSYAEALRELASTVEAKAALEAKVVQDAPKVLFADSVSTSSTTILVGELAKILKGNGVDIGANRLFERLREDGYLIRRQGTDWNMPTQRSMELGLFKIKETAVTHSDGHVTVSKTPKVTGKGQQYFVNRYGRELRAVEPVSV